MPDPVGPNNKAPLHLSGLAIRARLDANPDLAPEEAILNPVDPFTKTTNTDPQPKVQPRNLGAGFTLNNNFTLRNVSLQNAQLALTNAVTAGAKLSTQEQRILTDTTSGGLLAIATTYNGVITPIPEANRTEVRPTGIHVPASANIPLPIREGLTSGTISFTDLAPEHQRAITVPLQADDICPVPKGQGRDFRASFNPDGRVFPYTLFPHHALSNVGVPTVISTRQQGQTTQAFNPNSLRTVYYTDPTTGQVTRGTYFEFSETAGPRGTGGVNGGIIPANQSLVLIHDNRAHFIAPR